ncbi:NADP-dependent oxidoreductase [Gordonia sp. PP30]|uniref:NADP-dependent oxidoreductase n=1 Tax=unclassified Gordonia (in: high G+C Gram-positive bacteria) TaxID=2657482 RepID=UPI001FFEC4A2|nr:MULTISPECIES: NADP-dependent oxidoreductase [unclassified Gordonia (in: high G+C Gram-positive bacteria)]UQE74845.1 NADP-dependent oxidoreductase [Gordonia sp. PP30]
MSWTSTEVRLARRPVGLPDDGTWDIATVEVPEPGPGEFVVRTALVSLDPAMRGWLNDARSYVPPVELGAVMRANGAGEVVASRHDDFAVGEMVSGMFGVREYALSDGVGVVRLDLDVASPETWLGALGMAGMTAYFGLEDVARARPGETVVVSAAAGAVGSTVVQLAAAKGCRVIGVAGGPDKLAWLRDIGCDETIDRHGGDLSRRLRAVAPEGVDVYFDNVGGELLEAVLANLALGARIAICGAISTYNAETVPAGPRRYMSLLISRAAMAGFLVTDYQDRYGEAVAAIGALIAQGRFVTAETVLDGGVAEFPRALLGLFEGINTGKLLLRC